ncbi:MAG: PadR family transcriptional regulator [Actinomycetia bacterium]|nr:PadR family transcriptional regulator [Actinomycetes bacterium]
MAATTSGSGALTQLRRGALEHCVLALLESGERYGYDLVSELSDAGLVASEGTVYPLLSRLRTGGLVATSWRDSSGGPPRRYYSLTPTGASALGDFREAWSSFRVSVDTILASSERRTP